MQGFNVQGRITSRVWDDGSLVKSRLSRENWQSNTPAEFTKDHGVILISLFWIFDHPCLWKLENRLVHCFHPAVRFFFWWLRSSWRACFVFFVLRSRILARFCWLIIGCENYLRALNEILHGRLWHLCCCCFFPTIDFFWINVTGNWTFQISWNSQTGIYRLNSSTVWLQSHNFVLVFPFCFALERHSLHRVCSTRACGHETRRDKHNQIWMWTSKVGYVREDYQFFLL